MKLFLVQTSQKKSLVQANKTHTSKNFFSFSLVAMDTDADLIASICWKINLLAIAFNVYNYFKDFKKSNINVDL